MLASPLAIIAAYFAILFLCVFTWSKIKRARRKNLQKDLKDAQRPILTAIKKVEEAEEEPHHAVASH